MYVKSYRKYQIIEIYGFEASVIIPEQPPLEQMVNYGLPREEQMFRRTVVPRDIRNWDKKREEAFVHEEWHKRRNGIWVLIDGDPTYITGPAYVYFNYWITEAGELPDFRFEAVEFFQVWNMIEDDPDCFGILDIKARRLGDTEKALFLGWERVTRYRKSWFGMVNKNEDDAQENYDRVVMSNRDMIYFFKPKNMGSELPQTLLEFKFPPKTISRSNVSEKEEVRTIRELGSKIDFQSTVLGAYDGKRLAFFHGDEPGKVSPKKMDWSEQWPIVQQCLALNNGKNIVGKTCLTTTIEEIADGASVEVMKKLWDDSDPLSRQNNGRTTTGLIRYFRGYWLGANLDAFGRHKIEEAAQERANTIADLEAKGRLDEVVAYKRKFPATVGEALSVPDTDCVLSPYLLDRQINMIQSSVLAGTEFHNMPRRGNFEWVNDFGGLVKWVPSKEGRWMVSGHPDNPNAAETQGGYRVPGNMAIFGAGADPIDGYKPAKGGSYGAFCVGAMSDMSREPDEVDAWEGEAKMKKHLMVTDRCVCTYRYRTQGPYEYFEDALKTMLYYGCRVLVEKDKPGLIAYMVEKGFHHYVAAKPKLSTVTALVGPVKLTDLGIKADMQSISNYVKEIQQHVIKRSETYTHLELLEDMRKFNIENRTQRDLTVAWGWCRLYLQSLTYTKGKQSQKKRVVLPIKTYLRYAD